jgi:hypothetical protein
MAIGRLRRAEHSGVAEMKRALFACIILTLTVTVAPCAYAQAAGVEDKIRQTKEKIEAQIEKIREAREKADSEMALAKMRIGEQLRKSQDDLSRQLEILERFREQLVDQRSETAAALSDMQTNWAGMIDKAFSDVDSQIEAANSLLCNMQNVGDSVGDGATASAVSTKTGNCSSGSQTAAVIPIQPAQQPEQTGDPASSPPSIPTPG